MKKPTDLESRILEVLDSNIRVIQYSLYAVGFIGLAVIARSTYAFKKFTSSKDVPKEFISKAVKLQGKINGIECHQLLAPENEHFSVRLTIEHIPVVSLNLWKKQSKDSEFSGLKIELIGVRPTYEGVNKWIKPALESNPVIWFRLYGVDYEENVLYASVIVKRSWWKFWIPKDLSMIVLKENAGKVSPYLPSRQIYFNNIYPAYYRKLLHFEIKYMNKRK